MRVEQAYEELVRRRREESLLGSCAELLGWDELITMPPAGAAHRGEQLALLTGLCHERATDPRVGELLAAVEGSDLLADGDGPAAVNVREIRKAYDHAQRLPRGLVEEAARVTTLAQQEWEAARRDNDYARFAPWLARVVALTRERAEALGYAAEPYDALLDEYEPGARAADLASLFGRLRIALLPLLQALLAKRPVTPTLAGRDYPVERQRHFAEEVAKAVGFDFRRGRLDVTVHPFCSAIGPGDCRIATRFRADDMGEGLFSTLHEIGHAHYEQGLPTEHHGTPFGEAPSVALHESQARLWENTVGRSTGFWRHFLPLAQTTFPSALGGVGLEEFCRAVNRVAPTLIRASADEVTYNLHVVSRFELERALVAGDLAAADLPTAWHESYRRHLGIVPTNDAEGCLQDGHWGSGLIGYFPTYALGNLIAAQLYERAVEGVGDLEAEFAHGRFSGLLNWLREHVYRHGGRWATVDLLRRVTGAGPDCARFVRGLQRRYAELYDL